MIQTRPKEKEILYQLINYDCNRALLERVPHIRYLDMAIIFYYWKDWEDRSLGAGIVSKAQMEEWGYTLEELEKAAAFNTPRLFPVSFQPIEELIRELIGEELCKMEREDPYLIPMHVLTNQSKLFGAAAILYPQVLWAISHTLQGDLYILPSSIHECIIVPMSVKCSRKELEEIVKEINETQVPKTEILSNHVFIYRKEEDCIEL
ncbi:MAG: DUF5688 family protein [Eubacteriales bacterium]|nr:DUF5688 family protein [Eubacteriales bacterium]